jgi:AraC-like DNA-binding protein
LLRTAPADVVVVDPQVDGTVGVTQVREIVRRHPALPIVVYTYLSPASLKAVVELARYGVEHVVLHRFDDEPRRFLELLERLPGCVMGDRLLERLTAPLAAVPLPTARAIEQMVRSPGRFGGAEDLAAAAGITARQLYRQLDAAGFASPRVLVQGARVLRAYAYLREPECLLEEAAARLGYSAPRVLSRQVQEATGRTPTTLRQEVGIEEFLGLLATRLTARDATTGEAPDDRPVPRVVADDDSAHDAEGPT